MRRNNGAFAPKSSGSDLGDGDRGGVGSEDGRGFGNLRKAGEDVGFEIWDFGHGFDDEVSGVEGVDGFSRSDAGEDFVGLVLGDFRFSNLFGEEGFGEVEAALEGGGRVVDESYRDIGGLRGDEGDTETHLAGADDTDGLNILDRLGGGGVVTGYLSDDTGGRADGSRAEKGGTEHGGRIV